jgi:glycosyltransferase involved in cell wall biosynthesis
MPSISIITPVWNGLPYINDCIASVLSQEFQNWELLIGDNSSTDGTSEYLASLTDPRIRVFKHDTNLGISNNLNFLFSKANAPIAHILCADDYFRPNGLSNVVREWDVAGPQVAFICFSPGAGTSRLHEFAFNVLPKNLDPDQSRLAFFLFGNFTGNISNVSVRVSAVNATGGFLHYLKTAQDFEMWWRLAQQNNLILTDNNVVFVREHTASATHYMTKKGDDYAQLITIYEDLINQLSLEYDRNKLVSYFNTQICSQYFRTGIKFALRGRFQFLKAVLKAKSSILWNTWLQLLICTPLALDQNLRQQLGIKMAQNFMRRGKLYSIA